MEKEKGKAWPARSSETKPGKPWKRRVLEPVVIFALLTVAVWAATQVVYNMTAQVTNAEVTLYTTGWVVIDPASHYWGIISTGSTIIPVWVNNTGNVVLTINLTATSQSGCTVVLTPSTDIMLPPGTGENVDMTVTPTDGAGSSLSWQITVDYE